MPPPDFLSSVPLFLPPHLKPDAHAFPPEENARPASGFAAAHAALVSSLRTPPPVFHGAAAFLCFTPPFHADEGRDHLPETLPQPDRRGCYNEEK